MSYQDYGPYIPVVMLITFLALFAWVAHPKNSKKFDEASQLPFADDGDEKTEGNSANNGRDVK